MKKYLITFLAAVIMLSVFPTSAGAAKVTINVYNWGQYISDGSDGYLDVNAQFTKETGIEVNYLTYDSNETLYTKLKTGGVTIDVIIPSDYMIARLIAEDMLLELDFDNIPNYQYIDESYKNTSYDPDNRYSVPYTWGTVGLIYNSAYVAKEDTGSWELLWNEKYTGKILMFDNPRDAFAISQLTLGYDLNTEDEAELSNAAEKLKKQKPLVQEYVMDQIYSKMERAEAWIAPYYAGDYLMMAEENEDLEFYFPEEGFNLFIDAMCIPSCAKNKEAAEAYINFLCRPDICGQNLEYLGYSAASSAAKEYMDEEMASNEIAYPSAETLAGGQSFLNLSTETNQLMDSLWLDVTTASDLELVPIIGISTVIILVSAYLIIKKCRTKARMRRRGSSLKNRGQ